MDNFADILLDWLSKIISPIWGLVMPAPNFLAPRPEITRKDESDLQWWHIPVSVKHRWPRRYIPCCRASVVITHESKKNEEFNLRWRSDLAQGSEETTLIFGQQKLIPIAIRRDSTHNAFLTDHGWLIDKQNTRIIGGIDGISIETERYREDEQGIYFLSPGVHQLELHIKSGHLEWIDKKYEVRVPEKGQSNSHFSIVRNE